MTGQASQTRRPTLDQLIVLCLCAFAVLALRGVPHHWVHDHGHQHDQHVASQSSSTGASHSHAHCSHHGSGGHANHSEYAHSEPGADTPSEPSPGDQDQSSCELCITLQLAGSFDLPAPVALDATHRESAVLIEAIDSVAMRPLPGLPPVRGPPLA